MSRQKKTGYTFIKFSRFVIKDLNLKYFSFGYLPKIKYIYKKLGDYPINIIK